MHRNLKTLAITSALLVGSLGALINKTEPLTMPAFEDVLTRHEIKAIIAYLKTLWTAEQRQFQREESRDQPFPPEVR